MKKDLGVKTYIFPQPVLIIATYNEDGTPNAMNAAWGGIYDYDKIVIALSEHKTTDNLLKNKAFTVSIGDKSHAEACDYVGIVSGKDVKNKVEKAGFSVVKSTKVNAPVINELPLVIECNVDSLDMDAGILIGKIVNVMAEDSILTDDKIDMTKFLPIAFEPANHNYMTLGEVVGKAFSIGNKLK